MVSEMSSLRQCYCCPLAKCVNAGLFSSLSWWPRAAFRAVMAVGAAGDTPEAEETRSGSGLSVDTAERACEKVLFSLSILFYFFVNELVLGLEVNKRFYHRVFFKKRQSHKLCSKKS